MTFLKKIIFILVAGTWLAALAADPLENTQLGLLSRFNEYETQGNPAMKKQPGLMKIPHLEIPMSLVEENISNRLDERIKKALMFVKNGEIFIRWPFLPEEKIYPQYITKEMQKQKGIQIVKGSYFDGWLTSSRSLIIRDPVTGIIFSTKTSAYLGEVAELNGVFERMGNGHFSPDKVQTAIDAEDARMVSDFLADVAQKGEPLVNVVIFDEPGAFKIPFLYQGFILRDLSLLTNPSAKTFFIPAFSLLHETIGAEIAHKNGYADPRIFLEESFVKAFAKALAELIVKRGVSLQSAHGQNILVEFDENMKPTGRIGVRDLSDFYIHSKFVDQFYGHTDHFLKRFSQKKQVVEPIVATFSPFNGLHGLQTEPSWLMNLSTEKWDARVKIRDLWHHIFARQFEDSVQLLTGRRLVPHEGVTTRKNASEHFGHFYPIDLFPKVISKPTCQVLFL